MDFPAAGRPVTRRSAYGADGSGWSGSSHTPASRSPSCASDVGPLAQSVPTERCGIALRMEPHRRGARGKRRP